MTNVIVVEWLGSARQAGDGIVSVNVIENLVWSAVGVGLPALIALFLLHDLRNAFYITLLISASNLTGYLHGRVKSSTKTSKREDQT